MNRHSRLFIAAHKALTAPSINNFNKNYIRVIAIFMLAACVFLSCKKTNSLNSYPSNQRLYNYTITTTQRPNLGGPVINENYRFVYNNFNQVSQILYTTNDPLKSNYVSCFNYVGNLIYDTLRGFDGVFIELDTFVTDFKGNIDTTFIGGVRTTYQYNGNLLTLIDSADNGTATFTSYNGNFVKAVSSYSDVLDYTYTFYTDQFNRVGDYQQLISVARYGFNLYRTSSLVRSIVSPTDSIGLSYQIDAYSKVTEATAVSMTNIKVFDLQYESY